MRTHRRNNRLSPLHSTGPGLLQNILENALQQLNQPGSTSCWVNGALLFFFLFCSSLSLSPGIVCLLTIVSLSSNGALSRWVSILVAPLPVDAPNNPCPWYDVLHHLRTKQAALAAKVCFCLLHSFTCRTKRQPN